MERGGNEATDPPRDGADGPVPLEPLGKTWGRQLQHLGIDPLCPLGHISPAVHVPHAFVERVGIDTTQ